MSCCSAALSANTNAVVGRSPRSIPARYVSKRSPSVSAHEVRRKLERQPRIVAERVALGRRFEKEIERVDDREIGDEVDGDLEPFGRIRQQHACQPVRLRVLLPIQKMVGRLHVEPIRDDRRPAVRRRPQPDHLRPQFDRPIVGVAGRVMEGNPKTHIPIQLALGRPGPTEKGDVPRPFRADALRSTNVCSIFRFLILPRPAAVAGRRRWRPR